jgi:predicted Rossmann-fold nucleotide-binding protein
LFGKSFWERLINFQMFADEGLISQEDLKLIYMTDDIDDAFEYLSDGLTRGGPVKPAKTRAARGAGQPVRPRPKA